MTAKSESNSLARATVAFLGQAPRPLYFCVGASLIFWLFFLTLRFIFLFSYQDSAEPILSDGTIKGMYLGAKFDLRLAIFIVVPLLILSVVPWLNPFRYQRFKIVWMVWLLLVIVLISFLYILDFANYAFLGMRIDASFLRFLKNTETSFEMVFQTYPVFKIAIGLIFVAFGFYKVMDFLFSRIANSQIGQTDKRWQKIIVSTCVVFLMLFGMYGKLSWYPLRWSEAFFSSDNFISSLSLNPVLFFAQTFKNRNVEADALTAQSAYPDMADYLGVTEYDQKNLNYLRVENNSAPPMQGANVILVILESFAFYKTGISGNPLNPTPEFDRIAREGVLFDRFYTPHGGTARSIFAAVTGLPDIELHETSSRNPLIVEQHTIVDEYAGYEKLFFLGGSANWGQIRGLLSRNISGLKIFEEGSYRSPRIDAWGITDLDLFSEALEILEQQDKPFFSIIQTSGNHSPYTLPKNIEGFEKVDYDKSEVEPYGFVSPEALNSFRFMDFSIGKLIEQARTKAFFDRTLFVFIGDHGLIRSADHMFPGEEKLLLTQGHVPLLLYAPKSLAPDTISKVASEVDLLPTIASLTLSDYRNNTIGRSLFDQQYDNERYAFTIRHQYGPEIGLIGEEYLFRMHADQTNRQLYKIFSENPGENLVEENKPLADQMMLRLNNYYETVKYLRYNNKL